MADIKRLLNKKGWTGRELGILELTNMAVQFKQALKGEERKPLIEEAQFQKMINDIKDPVQGREYNGYIAIHEWLTVQYNIAQTQLQQAQLQFRTLEGYITRAILAEDVYRYIAKLPVIMTQKQYEETKAERIKAYFKDENGDELGSGIFNLIERAIHYYLDLLKKDPKKPNPLKAIRKKYLTQPVKSKLILSRYNKVTERGYYTLEDGRRSDQMTSEEWQEAITTPEMLETLRKMGMDTEGDFNDGDGFSYTYDMAVSRYIAKAKVLYNGGTEEEADRLELEDEYKHGLSVPAKWHYYTDPPEDLTKWDVIEEDILHELYFKSFNGEDPYTDENSLASMKDFYNEFKELADAMLKDMDSRYFKGDKVQASKLPVEEWDSTTISWRRLYELDFYGEKKEVESDFVIFDGNKRALFNGVAIVRPSDFVSKSRYIDEKGYYKEPSLGSSVGKASLEGYFTEAEDYAENVEIMESSRNTFLDSYYFVLSFNYVIEKIAEIYEVPELKVFVLPIEKEIGSRMDAFNALVPVLYRQIRDTDYSDKELQAKKMQVLKDYFQPVDYKALSIPEENKREIDQLLEGFQAFKKDETQSQLFGLMNRPSGEGA